MLEVLEGADRFFVNQAGPGRFYPRPQDRPVTRFERRGRQLGHGVRDLVFRRR
jgi:tRNA (guanine-N7-)-methyltransferase